MVPPTKVATPTAACTRGSVTMIGPRSVSLANGAPAGESCDDSGGSISRYGANVDLPVPVPAFRMRTRFSRSSVIIFVTCSSVIPTLTSCKS